MPDRKPNVGDCLFHNSTRNFTEFYPSGGVVYLGTERASIALAGGSGYEHTFTIISDLGQEDVYGGRRGWGRRNDWISLPAEVACEALQHVSTEATS